MRSRSLALAAVCLSTAALPDPIAQAQASNIAVQRASAGPASPYAELDPNPGAYLLEPFSVRAPGFRVLVQGADGVLREVPAELPRTVRGHVLGDPSTRVSGTLDPAHGFTGARTPATGGLAAGGATKVVELAIDADFEYFTSKGFSVAATVADVEAIVAGVDEVFAAYTSVRYLLTGIVIRTVEPDPYSSAELEDLFADILAEWQTQTIPFDVVQMFTGKELKSGSIIACSYTDAVVCSPDEFQSYVNSTHFILTSFEKRVKAHGGALAVQFGNSYCPAGSGCTGFTCNPFEPACAPWLSIDPAAAAQIDTIAAAAPCLDDAVATQPAAAAYGCGLNPAGSLTAAEPPKLGTKCTLLFDNPTLSQPVVAWTYLAVSVAPDPAFPCGTPVPGFGLAGPGATGELLISLAPAHLVVQGVLGTPWFFGGLKGEIEVALPGWVSLLGIDLFAQGVMVDPVPDAGVPVGLTNALQLTLGL